MTKFTNTTWFLAAGMAVLLIILGAYREVIFVNINEQIEFNEGRMGTYRVLPSFSFLKTYATSSLNTMKWLLTVLFTGLFLALSLLTFRFILKDKGGAMWLLYAYLVAFFTAGIIFVCGKLFGFPDLAYTLARVIMGALQSAFLLMLMIPARMLAKSN